MMFRRKICLGLLAAGSTISHTSGAQPSAARVGDDLLGLWGAEPVLGPQVRGGLTLERRGQTWSLRVAGFEVSATQQGDSVVMALPGGQGTLKVWPRTAGDRVPEVFWVQPPGLNASYATPVHLRQARANQWRGLVAPVPEPFSLYLMVTRAADATLRGTFRNPEANWPGRTQSYGVSRSGDHVVFTHPRTGKVQWTQPYDSARRTIAFDFGAPIVLSPRTREQAVGFVTRSPSLAPYVYRTPADMNDGWTTVHATRTQMDTSALQSIVQSLVAVDPLSETEPRVHALLVARDGRLVLDEYFRGYDAEMMHDLRSASKTMTSIMAGAAMQRGATLNGAAMQRGATLNGAALSANTPVGRAGITLGHLLSHSAGLACNDDDNTSPGNEDTMQSQQVQNDWYAFFMALPRLTTPGSTYSYCSAGINMAGDVIGRTTGQWLPRLFESALARPMAFGDYGINLMPTGEAYSGGGMRIRPRDLLKFGQLYLNGGLWRGVRLVPASWVKTSTAYVISRPDGSDDGYGWHRYVIAARGRSFQTYQAGGNGGQFLVVVPELRLTMVVTAGNYGQYDIWSKIREQLVPAIMEAAR
ncbi:serine hydrolase domain-containing protein [Gemmatimonas aurantiaca]|nr:serine hydrolase [Gemmatimonas aurantiaca]